MDDDDDLEAKIERAIRYNCFARDGEIEGIDFAVEAIMDAVREEREDDYRSTVLDLTTRE